MLSGERTGTLPTLLRFRLRLRETAYLRPRSVPAQGWFLALIAAYDKRIGAGSDWAGELHRADPGAGNGIAPRRAYTVSPSYTSSVSLPLWEDDEPLSVVSPDSRGQVRVPAGGEIAIRVGLAEDVRAAHLCHILPDLALPPFASAGYDLVSRFGSQEEPAARDRMVASWERLADAPPCDRLRLVFATPTAFQSQGDLLLRPEPERFWSSWERTWRDLAPFVPEGADRISEFLPRIAAFDLKTQPVPTKGGLFLGFTGWMELSWRHGTPESLRRTAAALASVSDFFGTGAKTAMGMGQTRCLFR